MRSTYWLAALVPLAACATGPAPYTGVTATVVAMNETDPMKGEGDLADDPAIWVNTSDPASSLILGTNKDEGVYVYALDGGELQELPVGQVNNVDLRGNIAVASNDSHNVISWFDINPETLAVSHIGNSPTGKEEPYGICAGMTGETYKAAVTFKDGTIQIWSATWETVNSLSPSLDRVVKLPSQLEGCVFDDANNRLFVGEEAFGVWAVDLKDETAEPVIVDTIAAANGLVEDVEGMSLWIGDDADSGYLVVSAQAADRYVVYDRVPPFAPRGAFTIVDNEATGIGGVTHTDGLDISSAPLPGLPAGLLIVQDDANPVSEINQNFKMVDWTAISEALDLN
ncbi:phytase [uncultured Hyphomonas sp.]|uniref:phytase n=1 Tax=uncultured Hyphomonas sp. TaxID=225298 RepID=UPI002AABF4FF|nr:phytase [uncultured Hyphomonas sp.]